ncbi:PrsW family intramembrane metalloprotease [Candidatus Eisenbacteria bacterium]|uniref:Protease PrsW n=1 Tax=Eiseniibacteriota bacterium TaxID=2212470 RepID=A0ABV6YIL8_UNCEI
MQVVFTTVFAIVPSILLLLYFYKRDLNPEPRGALLLTFLFGVLIVVPVVAVVLPIQSHVKVPAGPFSFGLFTAFLCAAIPEEFFKFIVVTRYSARHRAFDEPMDGIVYGATASLGFATFENIMYVSHGGWETAIARAFTAVPCHACLGAILGYYVGQARFEPGRKAALWWGLLAAILLHGMYDFPLMAMRRMSDEDGGVMLWSFLALMAACLLVLVVAIIWVLGIVRKLHRAQERAVEQLAVASPTE